MAVHYGQLNASFDIREMKCHFINFIVCQAAIFVPDILLCWRRWSHSHVHMQLPSDCLPTAKVLRDNFPIAILSSPKPDPGDTGLRSAFPANNDMIDHFAL